MKKKLSHKKWTPKPGDKVRWWLGEDHRSDKTGYIECEFLGRDDDYVGLTLHGKWFRVRYIYEIGPIPGVEYK